MILQAWAEGGRHEDVIQGKAVEGINPSLAQIGLA